MPDIVFDDLKVRDHELLFHIKMVEKGERLKGEEGTNSPTEMDLNMRIIILRDKSSCL